MQSIRSFVSGFVQVYTIEFKQQSAAVQRYQKLRYCWLPFHNAKLLCWLSSFRCCNLSPAMQHTRQWRGNSNSNCPYPTTVDNPTFIPISPCFIIAHERGGQTDIWCQTMLTLICTISTEYFSLHFGFSFFQVQAFSVQVPVNASLSTTRKTDITLVKPL